VWDLLALSTRSSIGYAARVGTAYRLVLVAACLSACTPSTDPHDASASCELDGGVGVGCPCDGTVHLICGRFDLVCSRGVWTHVDDACGEGDTGPAPTDAGPVCDGDVVAHGCPCDGTRLTICGSDIDYVCSHGTWFGHAGLCAMLDAGMPCSDEGRISCPGGHGTVCCYGQEQTFFDGPCGSPGTDGGPACGDLPVQGCPCDPDAGATVCDGSERFACTAGVWQPTSYACGSLCGSGP
jgi:hypothetical protein